ncbi:hypothetical protein [Amycolatopsis sp. NPDC051128]|uniref:hypothetical protein n=1 Tax=Amycolatopsis sp. NPDC051128 TaxID=3155412 RepID=UPI003429A8D5
MLWLFGQIWLWLIVAFVLGVLTAWLVLRASPRPKPEPAGEAGEPAEPRHEPTPSAAEQTQFIPAAWAQHAPDWTDDRFPGEEQESEPDGHREGRLPLPPQRGAQAENWFAEEEPAWPEADEVPDATRRWPHQPGRGG